MLRYVLAALMTTGLFLSPAVGEEKGPRFNGDIRPILADACFSCHGQGKKKGDLRLDQFAGATAAAASGLQAIHPGDPGKSEMLKRVKSPDAKLRMPPASVKKVLTPEQVKTLEAWIAAGAKYENHWSFETVARPTALGNPIDSFINARLQKENLSANPPASPETLIRRVAFTLTGLPPTLPELDQYLNDKAAGAYERMVDRYFGSPRHGEEMARHWLDAARYADTHGLHLDNERQMWAYRDWVIQAFNGNLPFDRFTIEQIAGDLLPNAKESQLLATGFNRCNVTTSEGGSINEEWIFRNAVDRTSTMMEVWLGLTGGCSVCHDHKFDPLTAKDYYSLYAFFHSSAGPALDGNSLLTAPNIKLKGAEYAKKVAAIDVEISALRKKMESAGVGLVYADPASAPPGTLPKETENVWFDDAFPQGSRVFALGQPTNYVDAKKGKVFSGEKALRRDDSGLAQDVCENMPPMTIPSGGKLFAYVFIQPGKEPKALMLQYLKGDWKHRAVWGDYDIIPWGAAGTTERVKMGPLPQAGKWARLEVSSETIGLKSGDQVTGFALTQHGGVVFWDKAGILGNSSPACDPKQSFTAWRKQMLGREVAGLDPELARLLKEGKDSPRLLAYYLAFVSEKSAQEFSVKRKELADLEKSRLAAEAASPGSFIFRDLPSPRQSFVMLRGEYSKPGEKVEPGTPAFLPPMKRNGARATRLDLANWLVDPANPLTSRVIVNRFWQQVFGAGLVKSSGDFGAQGELPSHPELLDYLASSFIEDKWDVRNLLRKMVLSEAFKRHARVTPERLKADPENRLLARGPRLRLDAEQIRDNVLFASGLIDLTMGGRGSMPYQPPNIWEPVGFTGSNTSSYKQDKGGNLYRRSVYVFIKRTAPAPFMANFDAPNREAFCAKRERSNTPLQALQLLNDVQHFEAAKKLAERMLLEGGQTAEQRIRFAFRLALAREPAAIELEIFQEQLARHWKRYQSDPAAAAALLRVGEAKTKAGLDEPLLAAHALLANLLFNLDETITRN